MLEHRVELPLRTLRASVLGARLQGGMESGCGTEHAARYRSPLGSSRLGLRSGCSAPGKENRADHIHDTALMQAR